ncbi:unnamed protein product [Spirodela intermedia]|uniref:GTP diphosphokinase n=1 Tax=Spirodela intermedia TaxID=51605 RepID=A0A7I8IPX3_SPIIN|nr:unnamed protein product [Spirodela intermedia]CAA6659192.1 unnamed protein product [Spirodela intermedia]
MWPLGPRGGCCSGSSLCSLLPSAAAGSGRVAGRFRCLLDQVAPRLAAAVSSGGAIAAAAGSGGGGGTAHSAVAQAIAHVAVTAVAIASGACLSTKVDFLWPRGEDQPNSIVLDGVELTGYPIFNDAKVLKAIEFARKAHHGQLRKTGEPYVTHCIYTGKILAALVPTSGDRAVNTVVAGILHDVIDDTFETLHRIEEEFGTDVRNLVAGVSKLSYINQANKLRAMLLGMVDDPRVVLIKLADRLHNMRTIYALPLPKAQAVAQETLSVWCSLASRLGVWALKAELEDLCFAVLQNLLQAVLPFDLFMDRRKRMCFLNNLRTDSDVSNSSHKVLHSGNGSNIVKSIEKLIQHLLQGITIREVYDARALRVVVGDKNGRLHGPAIKSCYSLLDIVHRLWTPVDGEFDDYIVNPKPSGYQSLHTAVQGPDSAPLEVQIRTQRMHEYAESGLAAHWLYKESDSKVGYASNVPDSKVDSSSYEPKDLEEETGSQEVHPKHGFLRVGHPVLRVEGSQLLGAVILRIDQRGRDLLVAVNFELEASEALADRRYSSQMKHWEAYAKLFKKVSDKWWSAPGHGDWSTCLEKYTLCRDGMYHKQDQFQRLLPTFIQVIDLTEQEEAEYWTVVSAVFEGKEVASIQSNPNVNEKQSFSPSNFPSSVELGINNKVQLLRTMLQWEEQVRHEAYLRVRKPVWAPRVVIICWPHGWIMRMRSGSTAADAARRIGLEGRLVCVNGQLALPHTELKDGDIVEVRL